MGLAPYGEPKYVNLIYKNLIDVQSDGSFRLNMGYFNYATGLTMTNSKFDHLFGGSRREPESGITQKEMDLARSIQVVTEEVILKICHAIKKTGAEFLCLAGGVALNCVANGKIQREKIFKEIWIQPASGDAGGALGAAYSIWYEYLGNNRKKNEEMDFMKGSFLGPSFEENEVTNYLDRIGSTYEVLDDIKLMPKLAKILAENKVVEWFQGAKDLINYLLKSLSKILVILRITHLRDFRYNNTCRFI